MAVVLGFQLERFLIKFPRAFFVGNGDGDECDFFDHVQSFLVFRFQFVNHQFVAVGILHDGHVTARRFKRLGRENMSIFQSLDRLVEIFHFEGRSPFLVLGFGCLHSGFGLSEFGALQPHS